MLIGTRVRRRENAALRRERFAVPSAFFLTFARGFPHTRCSSFPTVAVAAVRETVHMRRTVLGIVVIVHALALLTRHPLGGLGAAIDVFLLVLVLEWGQLRIEADITAADTLGVRLRAGALHHGTRVMRGVRDRAEATYRRV